MLKGMGIIPFNILEEVTLGVGEHMMGQNQTIIIIIIKHNPKRINSINHLKRVDKHDPIQHILLLKEEHQHKIFPYFVRVGKIFCIFKDVTKRKKK